MDATPKQASYDVIIIGGAIHGSSTAWWVARNPDFDGSILVVERDPSYEFASTSHTNSCIRQQFSAEVNIRISQFGAAFIRSFPEFMEDEDAPEIALHDYGYMYLAGTEEMAETLRTCQKIQSDLGAGTRILTPDQIAAEYPFYNLDGVVLGSHNPVDEGYFDGGTIFDWFKRKARKKGAEYIHNEVTAIGREGDRVTGVTLKSGDTIAAGTIVNASGPRAAGTARLAGFDLPLEPRRRYTYIFDAEDDLGQDLPLTIDPSGCHMRSDGRYFLCGCPPFEDPAMAFEDFGFEDDIWEEKLWPAIANRVPAFERVKVVNAWVGHYAFNTLDQNAIIGRHPEVTNFIFQNGFSGHGLQQSPATGRGVSELIAHGNYQTLDLTDLGYERVLNNTPLLEKAII
ncbi:MAG: NAD(P)/FAD-dependent oxidoreductase [Paracoccaceae bacterium]